VTAVSAIIPTRDRPDLLRDCLGTLVAQEVLAGALEVVVVDDGSTVPLEPVVLEHAGARVPVRYARQDGQGLNPARNHGAAIGQGDVLAYLDDDTLVSPGWARAQIDAFEQWGCDGLAGRIELQLEGDEPPWLSPRLRTFLSELDLGPSPCWLEDRLPVGANCAVTRAAFDRVDGFRSGLDRQGASLVSNGDGEFFRRVKRQGGRLAYWPAAHVRHRVPPERLTVEWFLRRARAQGVSDGLLDPPAGGLVTWGRRAREAARAARLGPIVAKGLLTGTGTTSAQVWLAYCRGRSATVWGRTA
jgi:glycosyltransferase involved in cell wall biosynthesis